MTKGSLPRRSRARLKRLLSADHRLVERLTHDMEQLQSQMRQLEDEMNELRRDNLRVAELVDVVENALSARLDRADGARNGKR